MFDVAFWRALAKTAADPGLHAAGASARRAVPPLLALGDGESRAAALSAPRAGQPSTSRTSPMRRRVFGAPARGGRAGAHAVRVRAGGARIQARPLRSPRRRATTPTPTPAGRPSRPAERRRAPSRRLLGLPLGRRRPPPGGLALGRHRAGRVRGVRRAQAPAHRAFPRAPGGGGRPQPAAARPWRRTRSAARGICSPGASGARRRDARGTPPPPRREAEEERPGVILDFGEEGTCSTTRRWTTR